MSLLQRKNRPTPKATRRVAPTYRAWDLPETAAQRERIVSQQGGGTARAAALFADLPRISVLYVAADEAVKPQGTRSRRKVERRAAK